MKNLKKSKIKSLYNNLHFLAIYAILLILSINKIYFLVILIPYVIYLLIKTEYLKYLIFISLFIILFNSKYLHEFGYDDFDILIIDKVAQNKYLGISKLKKIMIKTNEDINIGDYLKIKGSKIDNNLGPFDYNKYLHNKNIVGYFNANKIEVIDNYFVLNKIRYKIFDLILDSSAKPYIETLLFAKNELDKEINESAKKIGISHVLVISGMHISFLLGIVIYFLNKIFHYEKQKNIFIVLFLLILMILTNFTISVVRSSLLVILPIILGKKYKLLTKLDYLSIITILFLLCNPNILFVPEFYFSFLSSFVLLLYDNKKDILSVFKTSFVLYLINLPFVININYEINILTIIISPVIILLFELLIYPLTIIRFVLPFLTIFDSIYLLFEKLLIDISNIKSFTLLIGHINDIVVIIFLFLSFLFIYNQKILNKVFIICSYFIFLFLIYLKPLYYRRYILSMYNVGQGDSILFSDNKTNTNILIDAYGQILNYLKYDGINNLDYIFISHGDNDHTASLNKVYDYYKPKYLYTTKYSKAEIIDDYDFVLLDYNNSFYINEIFVNIIGPRIKQKSENDNSLVMYVYFENHNILFTGDLEKEGENAIISYFEETEILKVSHHGSNSSLSEDILNIINPKLALISVGKNNKYGHPNNKYLLNNYSCIRTDLYGSIYVYFKKNGFNVKHFRFDFVN